MKRGRYIEGSVVQGRLRAEVTADGDDPAQGLTSHRETLIELNADCTLSEVQWKELVAEIDKSIEREKRGGC